MFGTRRKICIAASFISSCKISLMMSLSSRDCTYIRASGSLFCMMYCFFAAQELHTVHMNETGVAVVVIVIIVVL